ncbi:MAG: hypothetical protein ABR992_15310 [Solirubrobacteraceae bacterium]
MKLHPRHRLNVFAAMVGETEAPITLGQEAADPVAAWIAEVGWEPSEAPVVLEPRGTR